MKTRIYVNTSEGAPEPVIDVTGKSFMEAAGLVLIEHSKNFSGEPDAEIIEGLMKLAEGEPTWIRYDFSTPESNFKITQETLP